MNIFINAIENWGWEEGGGGEASIPYQFFPFSFAKHRN